MGENSFPALSLPEVCACLRQARRPLLLSHVRPDGDTLGSVAALALLLHGWGHTAAWLCADPVPQRLSFVMEGIPLRPCKEEDAWDAVIAVDVASPGQLGALQERFTGASAMVPVTCMIDHHASGLPFAPHWIQPEAAAAGELVYAIIQFCVEQGWAQWDRPMAGAVYTAIASDTGGFQFANTTAQTHRIAANMLSCEVDAEAINHALFSSKPRLQLEAERVALGNLQLLAGGRLGLVALSLAARAGIADEYFETAIDIARSVAGVEIACTVREMGQGAYKVSLRSRGADVAAVAARFGGGGHLRAAGCSLSASTLEEACQHLTEALTPLLPPQNTARGE